LSEAGGGGRAPAAFEARAVWLLAAASLVCWALQYRYFWLPNNDFATFEAVARSFARLELPGSYQRLPLFPAAMALLAPLLPGRHPLLDAALLLNLAFAAATLPLLMRFAAGALGPGALLVPVLLAGTAQLHATALQPLVEPSFGFFVVLAFVLFQRRSPFQYAAAGAAALSRYEAVFLVAILAGANALEDRRWLRHGLLAAAAGAPFLLWVGLGAASGSGAAFYAADMERMGFSVAPHAAATLLKESFRGWWSDAPGPDLPLFLAAAALPAAAGVLVGWRRFRREAVVAALYLVASVGVVVLLGIDKARYLYPVLWIPLLFFAAGLLALLGPGPRERAARLPAPLLALAGAAALAAALWLARHWARKLAHAPPEAFRALDGAYLALLLALAAAALGAPLRGLRGRRLAAGATLAVAAFAATLPVLAGGLRAKAAEQYKIRFANYGVVLAADWLEHHAAPGERIVAMGRPHYLFLTDFEPDRIVPFYDLDARDAASLAEEMRRRDLTWLVATWRKPVAQAIDRVYETKFKWFLVDPFSEGRPVPGFEHVASLPLPPHLHQPPVQIYRLAPAGRLVPGSGAPLQSER
jgi:hypothetical protein